MESPKGFSDRVEKWLSWVPGIGTYLDRERRRETDKKIREHLASRLQEARSLLKRLTVNFSQKGQLDPLVDVDRLSAHLQQLAGTIRYASYGYGGIFDPEKIREKELDRLYSFDLSLRDDLQGVQRQVEGMVRETGPETLTKKIQEAEYLLDAFEEKFRQRNDFMNRPA